jgi:hypothetical protein
MEADALQEVWAVSLPLWLEAARRYRTWMDTRESLLSTPHLRPYASATGLMMSESPTLVTESTDTLKYFPHAVPRSVFDLFVAWTPHTYT